MDGQQIMMRRGRKGKVSLGLAMSHLEARGPQLLPNVALTSNKQETTAKDMSPLDSEVSEPGELWAIRGGNEMYTTMSTSRPPTSMLICHAVKKY